MRVEAEHKCASLIYNILIIVTVSFQSSQEDHCCLAIFSILNYKPAGSRTGRRNET